MEAQHLLGKIISTYELRARWAYSELNSVRWAAKLRSHLMLVHTAEREFDELSADEREDLSRALMAIRPGMVPALDDHAFFECQAWSKEQLARTYTLVRMAPDRETNIPFLSFVCCPRFVEDADFDPRVQADRIPFEHSFQQLEPIIVLPAGGGKLLLEGYLRSILFMRSPAPDGRIMVWHPPG